MIPAHRKVAVTSEIQGYPCVGSRFNAQPGYMRPCGGGSKGKEKGERRGGEGRGEVKRGEEGGRGEVRNGGEK